MDIFKLLIEYKADFTKPIVKEMAIAVISEEALEIIENKKIEKENWDN